MTRPERGIMKYWAVIEGDGDNYGVFVPDVLGAVGAGATAEEALVSASASLAVLLEDLREQGVPLPAATPREELDLSEFEPDEPYRFAEIEPIPLNPVSLAIDRELRRTGVTKAELARRIGAKPPFVSRLVDPLYWGHNTETLRRVAEALGMQLEVSFKARRSPRQQRPRSPGGVAA